ncbi:WG repeat-containing protein [Flavobacterium subsaxonicum]|nr:WG repeat-containing protein [Flavobacterium subsaxonicum]
MSDEDNFIQFNKGEKMGIWSSRGIVIPAIYDFVGFIYDGTFLVEDKGKHAYFNRLGEIIIPFNDIYDSYGDFAEGLARVRINDKWGFINKTGKEVIAPQFYFAENFCEGMAIVKNHDNLNGAINKQGALIINYKFSYLSAFKNGFAVFGNDKHGLINKLGKVVLPQEYSSIGDVNDNKLIVRIKEGNYYKEGVFTIGGTVDWNNNMDTANEKIRLYNAYKKEARLFIEKLYSDGCPCSYKRFRHYIVWKEPISFEDQELLFVEFIIFLEKLDANTFRCKTCGTIYTQAYKQYSISLWVLNVAIKQNGNYTDNGAAVLNPIPVNLGFKGYKLEKIEGTYFITSTNVVLNYLAEKS